MKQLITAAVVTATLLGAGAATAVNVETLPAKQQEQIVSTPRALKTGEPTAATRGGPAKGAVAPAPRGNIETKKQPPKKGDKPS